MTASRLGSQRTVGCMGLRWQPDVRRFDPSAAGFDTVVHLNHPGSTPALIEAGSRVLDSPCEVCPDSDAGRS